MDKKRLLDLAGVQLTEQDEMDGQGIGISDQEFSLLKSEIRETMEKLRRLQQRYRAETGRDYQPFI